ncbi:hypothetical protein PENTCL1PPCAC_10322, partial [Pristionchus entomophagus]
DHKAPDDVMKVTFEDTVNTLKSLFGKKESDFELRVRFFNQKMSTMGGSDVMKFAAEVNRLYQKGNLKTITEDQMKITIFLAGLDLPNQKTMRTHLFNAVGHKPEITFTELLEKFNTLKALERDVAVVQRNTTMMESDEWIHVTPRPIRLVGNDWFFKLGLKRAFSEEDDETVVAHIKSVPEFARGDSVYYRDRDGPNHEKWSAATVLRKMGKVLYEIERLNGSTVVAHANQLRRRIEREEIDPLSVLIESFDIGRNDTVTVNRPSPPTSPIQFNDVRRSPTVPRIVPTKDVENDKKIIVIEPTKDVENDKKKHSQSNPDRSKRDRKPPNRLTIHTTKGQSY